MGITSNLLYLLLLYAVLDKDGKLSVSTGLLLALGIIVATNCCNNNNNNNSCCCQRQSFGNNFNPFGAFNNNFAFSNSLF